MPKFSVTYVVTDTYRIEIEAPTAEEAEAIVQENSHDESEAEHIETLDIQVEAVEPVSVTSPDSLPCHVCGTQISVEELNENAAYTYPDNLPYCPDHQPCPDCFATDGKHTRASCNE